MIGAEANPGVDQSVHTALTIFIHVCTETSG